MTNEEKKFSILLVDDERDNLSLLFRTLHKDYKLFKTVSPLEALEILKENDIDIIISDHKMEEMDGVEFLRRSYDIKPQCIRLLVTAYSDTSILINAINQGKVYRYVKKPWEPSELQMTVSSALDYYKLRSENTRLITDLKELFTGTINAIIDALEAKDPYSTGKSQKVAMLAKYLALQLNLPHTEYAKLELAGLLHDIGMIGVPEDVINKLDALTPDEEVLFEKHVEHGVKILKDIKQLKEVVDIIKHHHENFDGSGYPQKLKGDDIPLYSYIISICDDYVNLTTDSNSKKGLSSQEALDEISRFADIKYPTNLVDNLKEAVKNTNLENA